LVCVSAVFKSRTDPADADSRLLPSYRGIGTCADGQASPIRVFHSRGPREIVPAARSVTQNHWTDARCAKTFWSQEELPAYRRLLADTLDWADPGPGEQWLDLGCGGGAVTRAIWERTGGRVAQVVGVDCAAANADKYRRLRASLCPPPGERVRFVCHDFSSELGLFPDESFDHAVSGLSISYAESYDETSGTWTEAAYDRLLAEVWRVLRRDGRFVFSVNVPQPSWLKVGLYSLGGAFQAKNPLHYAKKAWRMLGYGAWLKREARRGRFHYLPQERVSAKLQAAGYGHVQCRLSYARQAYIFRAVKRS
jgi:SAM-dependent methyltransferase